MRESISSNGFSTDDQLKDAVSYLEHNDPENYARFLAEFPQWEKLTWDGAWLDAEASKVDPDYTSWCIDWIEQNTSVVWEDGEPFAYTTEELWFCLDCYWLYHSLNMSDVSEQRVKQCKAGLDALEEFGEVSDNTDSNSEEDTGIRTFSSQQCDCCESTLGGARYRMARQ